jgi:hypothetical protein
VTQNGALMQLADFEIDLFGFNALKPGTLKMET